jgi:biotin carboxyl carrier protein
VSAEESIELIARVDAGRTQLLSPGVGVFSGASPLSTIVASGQFVGALTTLGRSARLVVPSGVHGVVSSKPPDRTRMPVGYGDVLYELTAVDSANAAISLKPSATLATGAELSVRSPQSGRFYHRGAPGEPSLCEVGRELEVGTPIGLVEVMKTFTQVRYRTDGDLPQRARIARVLAKDGGDIAEGEVLFVVEPR